MPGKNAVPTRKKVGVTLTKPKRVVDADDILTTEEAKLVRRGEAQLKRGHSKRWRSACR